MTAPALELRAAVSRVEAAWARALPPFGTRQRTDVSEALHEMDDAGLLALVDEVTALGRRVEALTAAVAGEVAERSPVGSRTESLAHRAGFASPGRLMAAASGGPVGRAAVEAAVGRATARRRTLTGETLPAVHPHVAAVLRRGSVSVAAAHLIVAMLDRVGGRAQPADVDAAEQVLAEQATSFTLEELTRLVKRAEALLDPDGVEPREEVLRQGRSLTMTEDGSGRLRLRGTFDPESGAPIKAALDAYVEHALRASRGHNHPGADGTDADGARPVMTETRSVGQIRADALAELARHVLACGEPVPGLPATTVVVRMDVEDVQERAGGCGFATLDGVDQPLSVATARRMACSARLVPAVLGTGPLPLDLGRASRLFSPAQVLALWERDGGCAACGQRTFVEAHHVTSWADGGATDLRNGVLLCSRCHHRVHSDDWGIATDSGGRVWFVPPPHLDPGGTPRPGVSRRTPREDARHEDGTTSRLA